MTPEEKQDLTLEMRNDCDKALRLIGELKDLEHYDKVISMQHRMEIERAEGEVTVRRNLLSHIIHA